MYTIMAQLILSEQRFGGAGAWRNGPEEVDTVGEYGEAVQLVEEYQLAFGPKFRVWVQS